ncbi:MAG: SLC13 family permease, partial [Thermoplasmata archaeon]|nr:SLC13 family permease [Thermoplasmata archaeon]
PIVVTAVVGAVLMVLTGCLRAGELYTSVQWNVIILIGALIPLGIAMVKTGAAELLGSAIAGLGAFLPPVAILMVLFGLTSLLTSVVSNNATVLVMLPVGTTTALALGLNPLTFALAVMFAASTSFLTPTGYQTNTLIWGPGGYRFTDFTRVGGPLTLILAIVTPLALALFFPL